MNFARLPRVSGSRGLFSRLFDLPIFGGSRPLGLATLVLTTGVIVAMVDEYRHGRVASAFQTIITASALLIVIGLLVKRSSLAEKRVRKMTDELRAGEQTLASTQAFLARVLDVLPVPVAVKNNDLRFIMINQAFCDIVHCKPDEVLGKRSRDIWGVEGEKGEAIDRVALQNNQQQSFEEWWADSKNQQRYFRVTKCRAVNVDGQPVVICTYEDLTTLHEQEQQQSGLRTFLQQVFDAMPNPLFVKNREHRYIMTNRAHVLSNGRTASDQVLGKRSTDFSPDVAEDIEASERKLFADPSAGIDEREYVLFDPEGKPRNTLIRKAACMGADGNMVIVGLNTDITDLRNTERELRRALNRFAVLVEKAPLGIGLIDVDGHFLDANPSLQKITGYSLSEFKGLTHRAISPAREEALDREKTAEMFANGYCAPFEKHYVHKNGNEVPAMVSGVVVKEGWQTTQIWGLVQDMTEQRAAEREVRRHRDHLQDLVREQTIDLVRAKEAAERASEAKTNFLSNMSHELRTPMHAILSFARLGETKSGSATPEKMRDYFDRIRKSGERLMNLLNDLLDLSKLEAGQMSIDPRPICLKEIIEEVGREFEAWLAAKQLKLDIEIENGLPRALADHLRIGQVVRNLVSNAVKFSAEGRNIRISLKSAQLPAGRRAEDQGAVAAVECIVADDGVGVPSGELESVFEKFVQSSTTRNSAGGTGLGLSICREIVQAHRGQIFARHRPEGGTEFVLRLPAVIADSQLNDISPRCGGNI